jgi:hypothetical protein
VEPDLEGDAVRVPECLLAQPLGVGDDEAGRVLVGAVARRRQPGVDFVKPFRPKFADNTKLGQI